MRNAVYAAILLYFARKTVRKVSESKEDWTKSQVASMDYARRRIFTGTEPESNIGNLKSSYETVAHLVKNKYPSIIMEEPWIKRSTC